MKLEFKLNLYEYNIRMAVILFAGLCPILLLCLHGYMPSLSSYWRTEYQPLFIIANAVTSYYFISMKNWQFSGFLLLMLTSFSIDLYPDTHNLLSIAFFIVTFYPFYKTNHFKEMIWFYLFALVVMPFNLLFAEIIAIETMCIFHGRLLYKVYKLNNERQ